MDHHLINRLLFAYYAGTASAEEQKTILSWLKESKEHTLYYKERSEIWALQHLQDIEDDKDKVYIDILEKLVSRQEKPHRRIWVTMRRIAAIFILGAAVGYGSFLYVDKPLPDNNEWLYTEMTVPNGSRSNILLPDGTTVRLNAGSRLTYRNDFGNDNRTVVLDGEALFEVKSDSLNPFRIKIKEMEAVVLGTVLSVTAYDEDPLVEIVLLEGKLRVEQLTNYQPVELLPNQRLSYDRENGKVNMHQVDAVKYTGWVEGTIFFADEPFEISAKQLERVYDLTIIINSEKLKKERFYGSFEKSCGIVHILKAIDVEERLRWSLKDNILTISEKVNKQ